MWENIKTSLISLVCVECNTDIHENWQIHYSNNVERRENKIRDSYR